MYGIGHRIALDLTDEQADYCRRAASTTRYIHNHVLAAAFDEQEANGLPSEDKPLRDVLFELYRPIRDQQKWIKDVDRSVANEAIYNVANAFLNMSHNGKRPQFHWKGRCDSFGVKYKDITFDGASATIPGLGAVALVEKPRFTTPLKAATISRTANRWFLSLTFEPPTPVIHHANSAIVGIDLGVSSLATLDTGQKFRYPTAYYKALRRQRQLTARLDATQKNSISRAKLTAKAEKLAARIVNIRTDFIHKMTTELCRTYGIVCMEDLRTTKLITNDHLGRAVRASAFRECRRQVEYKTHLNGGELRLVKPNFPSSKLCSACNCVNDGLTLEDRSWTCVNCGKHHKDRDRNAATNIRNKVGPAAPDPGSAKPSPATAGKAGHGRKKAQTARGRQGSAAEPPIPRPA